MSNSASQSPNWDVQGQLNRLRELAGTTRSEVQSLVGKVKAMGRLYLGQSPTASGESTRGSLPADLGRVVRVGLSHEGKKVHIVREVSYNQSTFLCGRPVDPSVGLASEHFRLDRPFLCGSCRNLAKKGAR